MLEFILMLLDRMIYSSKSIRLKLLMQWVTVIGFHIWIFFVLPGSKQYVPDVPFPLPLPPREARTIACLTSRYWRKTTTTYYTHRVEFANNGILPVWYLFKCIYWYFSARQVRFRLSHSKSAMHNPAAPNLMEKRTLGASFQIRDGYLQFNINLFFLTRGYGAMNRYLCTLPVHALAIHALRCQSGEHAWLHLSGAVMAGAVSWPCVLTDPAVLRFRTLGTHRPGLPPGPVRVRVPKRGGLDGHQNHPDVWPVAQD